jgi:tRNA A37 threonylcarbamoyladenosine dehydratase
VPCVYSQEVVRAADASCEAASDGSLNCHGYGSLVSVTATFGMAAAGWVINQMASGKVPNTSKMRYNARLRSAHNVD